MKKQFARFKRFLKRTGNKIARFPGDFVDRSRNSMIPPRSMDFVGGVNFIQTGQVFKGYFVDLGGLLPNHRVLDVGCGIGRMAVPLTGYLSGQGEYQGFDIVKKGIAWCQRRISPKFGNFHFQHTNVYSKHYNLGGNVLAKDFRFPFGDRSFDFVFLTSVFTHMLPPDLENYLSEISRVLKPGSRCLITFFLLNDESGKLVRSGRSTLDFKYAVQGCLTTNEKDPEAAIAYQEEAVAGLFKKHGLTIVQPVRYGSWCGRERFLSYQDIVIAVKDRSN